MRHHAKQRNAFAVLCQSVARPAVAVRVASMPCLCYASHSCALAVLIHAKHCLAVPLRSPCIVMPRDTRKRFALAVHCVALPRVGFVAPLSAAPRFALPCLCFVTPYRAMPSLCCSNQCTAPQSPCCAARGVAMPYRAMPGLCSVNQCVAFPCFCCAVRGSASCYTAMQSPLLRVARQCPAMPRRATPSLRRLLNFLRLFFLSA